MMIVKMLVKVQKALKKSLIVILIEPSFELNFSS